MHIKITSILNTCQFNKLETFFFFGQNQFRRKFCTSTHLNIIFFQNALKEKRKKKKKKKKKLESSKLG
jgi:hypothetical protein